MKLTKLVYREPLEVEVEINSLEDWRNITFESSSVKTKEFISFSKMFRSKIKKEANLKELEIINWSNGHFYCSAFLKNKETEKFVYLSISDVRHFKNDWYDNILVRTAKNEKDYTGGSNRTATINNIGKFLYNLTI